MDDDQTTELMLKAYDAAPPHIQAFIESGKMAPFVLRLQQNMSLHVDIADEVSNALLLTLLGVTEPAELPETLKNMGLSEEQIIQVIKEANREIFIPVREETKQNVIGRESHLAAQPKPVPPPPAYQAPVQAAVSPTPYSVPVVPESPAMRTMVSDVEHLKEAKSQASEPYTIPSPPKPVPPPVQQPQAPRPIAPPPPPIAPRAPIVPPTPQQTPNETELAHTLKKYGIDPYREPVE